MRKHTLAITAAIVMAALIAVPIAFAQHAKGMRGEGFGGPMFFGHLGHAKQALGLTDQQTSDIKAIFKDLREQNRQFRQSQRSTMQQVAQMLINNPNDISAAQALIDQQTANERTMKTNAISAASKALNVLTPEQRSKLGAMLQERMGNTQK
jgi:Spy/CpxP family protein refolding chaperone